MDPIEKAIRTAFEKGDPSQRAFREKVYRSAFAAMERSLQANPNVTEAIAQRRRETLSAKITEIESEFIPAVPSVEADRAAPSRPAPEIAMPEPAQPRRQPAQARVEPVVSAPNRTDPAMSAPAGEEFIEPPARGDRATRSRRSWLTPLVSLGVLAMIVGGAWWWLGGEGGAQQPTPPQVSEQPRPAPAPSGPPPSLGGANDLADWIPVFDPSDPTTVTAPGDSRAEVAEEDGRSFIRIRSGASGSPVLFDIGQGILEQISGRRAIFAILASVEDGADTQISVECTLAELGDCGRRRFPVGVTRDELLFEVDVPAGDPGSGGVISINPDIENGGKSVDIHAIKVSIPPAG